MEASVEVTTDQLFMRIGGLVIQLDAAHQRIRELEAQLTVADMAGRDVLGAEPESEDHGRHHE